jgi:2-(1,2-epoxy-1,2-dihydrophenyl)acetyl-CoA isomerase
VGETVRAQYNPIIRAIRRLEKPVVCAVNGVAAGAGANWPSRATRYSRRPRLRSFSRSVGSGSYRTAAEHSFPRLVGLARASGLALLGGKVGAAQARDWGLIWETCEPASLMPRAMEVATDLATQPTRGFALTKQAFNESLMNDLDAQLDLEADLQGEAARTADFLEGVAAFRAKRPPVFRGQ